MLFEKSQEIDNCYKSLFCGANVLDKIRLFLAFLTIMCLMLAIIAHGYYLYAVAGSALLLQFFSWCVKINIDKMRYIANEFQKISMLSRAYNEIPSAFHLSHLTALISKHLTRGLKSSSLGSNSASDYEVKDCSTPRHILISMIHENCYWNHHLYRSVFMFLVCLLSAMILLILIPLFFSPPHSNRCRLYYSKVGLYLPVVLSVLRIARTNGK